MRRPALPAVLQRHRRVVAALLAAGAVAVGLRALAAPAPTGRPIIVASRDVAPGALLRPGDLALRLLPAAAVPDGAGSSTTALAGRRTAGPLRRGEVVTDVRLVQPGLLRRYGPGVVATPVRIADAGTAALVRPGDRIDLLGAVADPTGAGAASARVVAADVRVLAVPPTGTGAAGLSTLAPAGALVVVATGRDQATDLAGAAAAGPLSLVLRP